jgi:hypothetical protein
MLWIVPWRDGVSRRRGASRVFRLTKGRIISYKGSSILHHFFESRYRDVGLKNANLDP